MAMLQQNGQSPTKPPFPQNQHVFPSFPAGNSVAPAQDPTSFFNNLDASSSAAKQLAALNAVGIARRATQSGGTSGTYVGGMPPPSHSQLQAHHSPFRPASAASHPVVMPTDPSLLQNVPQTSGHPTQPFTQPNSHDPSAFYRNSMQGVPQQMMAQHGMLAVKQRQQQFLVKLAKLMEDRKTPLPPFMTGVSTQYDPTRWKNVEPATEVGGFKLAGRDIDIHKLWTIVLQLGGSAKLTQANAWSTLLPQFGLPERFPGLPEGAASTAQVLASHFTAILGPSEELYIKNLEQRQARLSQGQPHIPNGVTGPLQAGLNGGQPYATSHTPQMRMGGTLTNVTAIPSPGVVGVPMGASEIVNQTISPGDELDLDPEGRKRKLGEPDDLNGKRTRRKTDSEPPQTPSGSDIQVNNTSATGAQRNVPSRRKIEYVPLIREVDSAGGRDVQMLQQEMQRLCRGRQLRDINEWGTVHVEALMMSLRSRLSTELSYALSTISILSTMRGGTQDSGFPIGQCVDLLDELLELLEDLSFGASSESDVSTYSGKDSRVTTNRELVNLAQNEGQTTFSLRSKLGERRSEVGPSQRPGDLIRISVNILRNFSAITDNQAFMANHPIIVDLLLRLTRLEHSEAGPHPASKALSLPDLIIVRKDVLGTLVNLAGSVTVRSPSESNPPPASDLHKARQIFELVSSYLSDPAEAITPSTLVIQSGAGVLPRVPILVESALEVFTRFAQPDSNRRVLLHSVPQSWMWDLISALVHRLPVADQDFQVIMREESWLLYTERTVMALYSLSFQMTPDMKRRVKLDRSLGLTALLMRLVKKLIAHSPADFRQTFFVCARRAVETMKLVDDCSDSFDASQPNMPPLTFGMGYGEVGDEAVEKGTGVLGGYREELLWGVMTQRDVDDVMFNELESLTRVESS